MIDIFEPLPGQVLTKFRTMRGFQRKNEKRKYLNFFFLILILILSASCLRNNQDKLSKILEKPKGKHFLLGEIQNRGKLIAVTDYNSTDYFIYRGAPMGYQFERLKIFADFLGVKLEIKVDNNLDEAIADLQDGKCDLIAMGLTITAERRKEVAFADPYMQTRQMLVQRKPKNWRKMHTWDDIEKSLIRNPLDLEGKTVWVQKGSVYARRLNNLEDEIGGKINVVQDSDRETERLIEAVNKGEIDYTVCDEQIAQLNERLYSDLDISTPLSFPQNLAWAVKKGSDSLRIAINYWMDEFNDTKTSAFLYHKYFTSPRATYMARSEALFHNDGTISQYDDIIREACKRYGLDWRLMASLMYQESQFHPDVKSWAGAFGLMQLMPQTAEIYGVDSTSSPREQIEAGIKYLHSIDQQLPPEISDTVERVKFILAAYNMGIAHIYDARRLAEKNGKDPNIWTNNVDFYVLNKSNPKYYQDTVVRYGYARGEETYNFVNEILDRYEHYKNVIED